MPGIANGRGRVAAPELALFEVGANEDRELSVWSGWAGLPVRTDKTVCAAVMMTCLPSWFPPPVCSSTQATQFQMPFSSFYGVTLTNIDNGLKCGANQIPLSDDYK